MKNYFQIGISLLIVCTLKAEPHTYTGVIVNARCSQAAEIISRNSRGYTPPVGVSAFAGGAQYKQVKVDRLRKPIMRHCPVNAGVTEFALLDDGGNFLLLNETGNKEVTAEGIPAARGTTVIIRGNVDRSTLNVLSLSKRKP